MIREGGPPQKGSEQLRECINHVIGPRFGANPVERLDESRAKHVCGRERQSQQRVFCLSLHARPHDSATFRAIRSRALHENERHLRVQPAQGFCRRHRNSGGHALVACSFNPLEETPRQKKQASKPLKLDSMPDSGRDPGERSHATLDAARRSWCAPRSGLHTPPGRQGTLVVGLGPPFRLRRKLVHSLRDCDVGAQVNVLDCV